MRFDIITIFPDVIDSYLNQSVIKRARAKKLVEFHIHDLRHYTKDGHRKVDSRPFGGGPGMVIRIEPLVWALDSVQKSKSLESKSLTTKIILFSVAGKPFNAKIARQWAEKYERIIMIAGRYEGVDERIRRIYKIDEISVGPYVLTGGELPALIVADAISRHIPGVLGKEESLEERRYGVGVPVYTRPEVFTWNKKNCRVPKVLLSGNHAAIDAWRKKHARGRRIR